MQIIKLRSRTIGKGHPTYIVAEIGINHNGSFDLAKQLVEESARAGADAVKFQKRDAPSIMVADRINKNPIGRLSQRPDDIVEEGPAFGQWSYPDIRLELPDEAWYELKSFSEDVGVDFFASPWDGPSVEFLVKLGVELLKVPSVELRNREFLEDIADARLPLIVSTGTSTIHDVDRAMRILRDKDAQVCLLQCTSAYPSKMEEIDLNVIKTLEERYDVPVGYSGHEPGIHVAIAAVALGACVIERHVTLDRRMNGPDHAASLNMEELRTMVSQIRDIEVALGSSSKRHYDSERPLERVLGKSVVSRIKIKKGTVLSREHLTAKGPATGIPIADLDRVIGKRVVVDVEADSLLMPEHIADA